MFLFQVILLFKCIQTFHLQHSPPHIDQALAMAYSTPVNAFYEAGPQDPMLPTLTLQTEFIATTTPSSSTLTQEVPCRSKTPTIQNSSSRSKTHIAQRVTPQSPVPQQTVRTVHFQPSDDSDSDDSDQFNSGALLSDSDEEDGLIPKPAGEVERPNRGGYTLQLALDWDDKLFNSMKVSFLCCFLFSS